LRLVAVLIVSSLAACGPGGSPEGATPTEDAEQQFPDVIDVSVDEQSANVFDFSVTITSLYDSPERYADGWRIIGPDGTVYGEHTLAHDHASEQPFTRTQTGVEIPDDVAEVTVEGRDSEFGYGGETFTVTLGE
jgi:hypothetical protein